MDREEERGREEAYITVMLSLANGALNCSIVGLALPLFGPGAGLAARLVDLLNCLLACFVEICALALALANNLNDMFMAPSIVLWSV